MIKNRAYEAPEKLVFETTPPYLDQTSHGRFRGQRNLPYRDAAPYNASIYYWWWAFLKRNSYYQRTCASLGYGKLSGLYQDFGDVFEADFLTWWSYHQGLFAEKTSLIEQVEARPLDPALLYQIDPQRPLSQIQAEIKALHMHAHAIQVKYISAGAGLLGEYVWPDGVIAELLVDTQAIRID